MPSSSEKKYPLILPPPQQGLNEEIDNIFPTLPTISLADQSTIEDEELGRHILVGKFISTCWLK